MNLPIGSCRFDQAAAHVVGGGGGGGPTFPCAGTTIVIVDPNNLTTGNWTQTAVARNFNVTDPSGTANNATSLQGQGTTAYGETIGQTIAAPSVGTTYSVSGYLKSVVSPPWMLINVQEAGTFQTFGAWFNLSTGAVGSYNVFAGGAVTCAQTLASTNGYYRFSLGGTFSVTVANPVRFNMFLVDADNSGNGSITQIFHAWGMGT